MTSKDATFFNTSEKHEVAHVCGKYANPEAVREFIHQKASEGVIKYWTHEKLYAFLAENGFERAARPEKLTMEELEKKLHEQCNLTLSDAHKFILAFTDVIEETLLNEGSIAFSGLGTLKIVERAARKGRNPRTGQEIDIPAKKTATFTAAKALKEALAKETR